MLKQYTSVRSRGTRPLLPDAPTLRLFPSAVRAGREPGGNRQQRRRHAQSALE